MEFNNGRTMLLDAAFVHQHMEEFLSIDRDAFAEDAWNAEAFLHSLPGKYELSQVVVSDGRLLGYAIVSRTNANSAHFHRLATALSARGRGVAKTLMDGLVRNNHQLGILRLTLEFDKSLNLGAFYESVGYARLGQAQVGAYLFEKGKTASFPLYGGSDPQRVVMHHLQSNGETVLVTGGAGFVGLNLCLKLLELGYKVRIIDNLSSTPAARMDVARSVSGIETIVGDITDYSALRSAFEGVSSCVHLAFPTSRCDRQFGNQFAEVASTGTLNVMECCRETNSHCLYVSSISVYGVPDILPITEVTPVNPFLIYGVHKLLGEYYVNSYRQMHGLSALTVRLGDVFGSFDNRSNAIRNFFAAAGRGDRFKLNNDGTTIRSYVHAQDVALIIANLLKDRITGPTVNLVNQDHISLKELAVEILAICGRAEEVECSDGTDPRHYLFDNQKLRGLNHHPITPIRKALRMGYQKGDFI